MPIPLCIDIHYLTENANGIKYLYASLDRHPYVRAVVGKATLGHRTKNC